MGFFQKPSCGRGEDWKCVELHVQNVAVFHEFHEAEIHSPG